MYSDIDFVYFHATSEAYVTTGWERNTVGRRRQPQEVGIGSWSFLSVDDDIVVGSGKPWPPHSAPLQFENFPRYSSIQLIKSKKLGTPSWNQPKGAKLSLTCRIGEHCLWLNVPNHRPDIPRMNRVSWVLYLWLIRIILTHTHPRLDSIGIAGFSHDFGTLRGKGSAIADVFDCLSRLKPTFFQFLIFRLGGVFPILAHVPSPRKVLEQKFSSTAEGVSRELLEKTRMEKEGTVEGKGDYSVMGRLSMFWFIYPFHRDYNIDCIFLVQASSDTSGLRNMSEDEVMAEVISFSFFTCSDLCLDTVILYIDESAHCRWLRNHI